MINTMKTKNSNYEPFVGSEYKLNGITDYIHLVLPTMIFLTLAFFLVLIGIEFINGLNSHLFGMLLLMYLCILVLFVGLISLIVFLTFRNSHIKIDKTGISGKSKLMGKRKLGLTEFSYQWNDIKSIRFENHGMENLIAIEIVEETYVYSFSYRFVAHKQFINAIRTFARKDILDEENIKEVENSYSYGVIFFKCFGLAILFIIVLVIRGILSR